ncbi:hypothetical protein [Antarcticirhabdus aurantiaca]|uniref:Uncharacterized protein n=1 Tax=Antarcticirhabdus aurantiaca TaxID=2606717 RepID=A0ACD4NLX1_9HYPH|nr:hypothetical protein [Antarcticirhabdus aurantiaca]WAJ27831.1 hypothetical protein OXU80_23790 [Jeongeuplla avenae]
MSAPVKAAAEDGEAGTTLVELLVAMALLSLVALFIGEGIHAIRRMAPVAARLAGADEVAAVRQHLNAVIGEAVASLPLGAVARLDGTGAAVRFVAPADPLLEAGGLSQITLSAEPGPGGRLALVERRAVARAGASPVGEPVVLLDGIAGLRLAYRGAAHAGWSDTWDGTGGTLPALLQIQMDLPPGDPRRFAPLLVHPLAAPAPSDGSAG